MSNAGASRVENKKAWDRKVF